MKKGLFICSAINLSVAALMIFIGFKCSSPIEVFFCAVAVLFVIPALTLIIRVSAFIKFSSVVLFVTSLITGLMVLYSISGFFYFDKSWGTHLVQAVLYAVLTFYLLGFSGYLKELIGAESLK